MKKFKIGSPELILGGLGLLCSLGKMVIDGKSEQARQEKMKAEITDNAVKAVMEQLKAKES